MCGMHMKRGGYVVPSNLFTESLFAERGIDWITRAHVSKVDKDRVYYETLDGAQREQEFDFAMLLPPFSGAGLRAYDREGSIIHQATHVTGIRRTRYHGLPKTRLEHACAAVAINLIRLDAWWTGNPLDRTRTSHLQRLHLTPPPERT